MGVTVDQNKPAVYINGRRIAGEWAGGDLVALAKLRVNWGKTDVYADPTPSTLTLEIIDPGGQTVATLAKSGAPVIIARGADEKVFYRGRVSGVRIRSRKIHDPIRNRPRQVFVAIITAADVLADLGNLLLTPPNAAAGGYEKNWGARFWPQAIPLERTRTLLQMTAGIVSSIGEYIGGTNPPFLNREIRGDEKVSALTIIKRAFSQVPLAWVNYNHDTDRIAAAFPAAPTNLRLTYTAGKVTITVPNDGLTIPAGALETNAEPEIESTVTEAIDGVAITFYPINTSTGQDLVQDRTFGWEAEVRSYPTARGNAGRLSQRFLEIEVDSVNSAWMNSQLGTDYVNQVMAYVNGMNDRFLPPSLDLDLDRLEAPSTALVDHLFRLAARTFPIYIAGSLFSALPNVSPLYQLIGGSTTWTGKTWRFESLRWAAVATNSPNLRFDQLSASSAARVSDVDPTVRLGDLRYITEGVPA